MKEFFARMIQVVATPETFFERIRNENRWGMPVLHLLFLAFFLSLGSVIAWRFAIPGDTPINSSLGSQMDVYLTGAILFCQHMVTGRTHSQWVSLCWR
jgi:hypothetical protein